MHGEVLSTVLAVGPVNKRFLFHCSVITLLSLTYRQLYMPNEPSPVDPAALIWHKHRQSIEGTSDSHPRKSYAERNHS